MSVLTIELLNPDAKRILEDLAYLGLIAITEPNQKDTTKHKIMELKGLGAETWKDESVADYIKKERESWDS